MISDINLIHQEYKQLASLLQDFEVAGLLKQRKHLGKHLLLIDPPGKARLPTNLHETLEHLLQDLGIIIQQQLKQRPKLQQILRRGPHILIRVEQRIQQVQHVRDKPVVRVEVFQQYVGDVVGDHEVYHLVLARDYGQGVVGFLDEVVVLVLGDYRKHVFEAVDCDHLVGHLVGPLELGFVQLVCETQSGLVVNAVLLLVLPLVFSTEATDYVGGYPRHIHIFVF